MTKRQTHTRAIQRLMLELQDRGELETCWRDHPEVVYAACDCFGSWEEALSSIRGCSTRMLRWSKDRFIEELIKWEEANNANLNSRKPACYKLRSGARKYYGSFHGALDALNLNDPYRWTRKQIIDAIQNRYVNGLPLNERKDRSLYCVARRKFGTWNAALRAAGLSGKPQLTRKRWTKDLIICELKEWSASSRCLYLVRRENYPLYMAAKHHFGTWRKAVAAAGLELMLGNRNKNSQRDT